MQDLGTHCSLHTPAAAACRSVICGRSAGMVRSLECLLLPPSSRWSMSVARGPSESGGSCNAGGLCFRESSELDYDGHITHHQRGARGI